MIQTETDYRESQTENKKTKSEETKKQVKNVNNIEETVPSLCYVCHPSRQSIPDTGIISDLAQYQNAA